MLARLSVLPLIALMAAYKGKPPEVAPVLTDGDDGGGGGVGNGGSAGSGREKLSLCRRVCCWFRAGYVALIRKSLN